MDHEHEQQRNLGQQDLHHTKFKRFELDLQFIQLLGDPGYVRYLVQSGYLRQQKFLNYLKYLEYFQKPQFIVYIRYPQGLKYLKLLLQPDFVRLIQMAPFQRDETGFSPFERQLFFQGYEQSKITFDKWNNNN